MKTNGLSKEAIEGLINIGANPENYKNLTNIDWNKEKLKELKVITGEAKRLKLDNFHFEGEYFLTFYAEYLVEYLETLELP